MVARRLRTPFCPIKKTGNEENPTRKSSRFVPHPLLFQSTLPKHHRHSGKSASMSSQIVVDQLLMN